MVEHARVAVVTGASGCFGGAIARRLAAQGSAVLVAYRTNRDAADAVVDAITCAGGSATSYRSDLTDPAEVRGLFDAAQQRYGAVDVVVNAARLRIGSRLVDVRLQDYDRILQTNVRGAFMVNQQAAHRLRPGGAIVNLLSGGSRIPPTSDAAVEAITRGLAGELAGHDITVNAVVCAAAAAAYEPAAVTIDVPETVAHLAGPTRWLTGQVIVVQYSPMTEQAPR